MTNSHTKIKYLVLGSGGREHAIVWHIKKSLFEVEAAPGSDAISNLCETWAFNNFEDLKQKCIERKISHIIVGPEAYLAEGLADFFEDSEIEIFGPSKRAALLESDKSFSKDFCKRHHIPTAESISLTEPSKIEETLMRFAAPYVVKASGLAAGKGVLVTSRFDEAADFARKMLQSHTSILVERYLQGGEVSVFFAVRDGSYCFLGAAQDHKRLLDGDLGPNTGGMGAFSPPDFYSSQMHQKTLQQILMPTLEGLKADKTSYHGFLFLGLMLCADQIYLLEYNCRMGDPETQSLMMRLETPLPEIIEGLKSSPQVTAKFSEQYSMNTVIAADGYPESPKKGVSLGKLPNCPDDIQIFHAGTKLKGQQWETNGGRLFSVTTKANTISECREKIYQYIEKLDCKNSVTYRKDIGHRATLGSIKTVN